MNTNSNSDGREGSWQFWTWRMKGVCEENSAKPRAGSVFFSLRHIFKPIHDRCLACHHTLNREPIER